jgi:RimJ/RimL family protein N-acetyltransferase
MPDQATQRATEAASLRISFGGIELRQFRGEDTEDLYRVRNHESVRGLLSDPRPLSYESHVAWVDRNLTPGRDILLFVVRWKGEAIGFTLLKRLAPDTVEVGVMFREANRHPGVPAQAAVVMLYLAFEYFGMRAAVSYVLPAHERAIALNRAFGPEVESDKPGMLCFRQQRASLLRHRRYRKLRARLLPRLAIVTE